MSGSGDKKKRSSKGHGWEEAKDEFYQESYQVEVDFEALERDPKKITTLLPSTQNRAATVSRKATQKEQKNKSTVRRRTSNKSNYTTTVRRHSVVAQDNYVAMMPDLSENLSNEERTWEEIRQIKAMPISMSQKKEIKAKLQRATKLRLQGFEQFKWQGRKIFQQFRSQWKEAYSKLELWQYSLKQIEGNCGTGVVTYFQFIKWLMFLNIVLFMLMFLFIMLPMILSEVFMMDQQVNHTCRNNSFPQLLQSSSKNGTILLDILDLIQGTNWMENTLMFYGKYDCLIFGVPSSSYYYNLPFAYVLVTLSTFAFSLAAIVRTAAQGFKDHLIKGEGQFYYFCNLIFGGWDFCIHNEKSANMKHKALFNEMKSRLTEEKIKEEKKQRTFEAKIKLYTLRTIVNITVLLVLSGSAALIYWAFDFQTNLLNDDQIGLQDNEIVMLLIQYLPSVAIVLLNAIVPLLFSYLVQFEGYSPMYVVRMTLLRTVFLRLASIVVLLASIYLQIDCKPPFTGGVATDCQNSRQCWETYAGQQFYRLVLLNFVMHVLTTFVINFPRMLLAKHCKCKLATVIGEQQFDLSKHVLDVVYGQALCWLGTYFCPVLPAIAAVELFFMFYVKKFTCLVNSKPSATVDLASRSKSMFMTILLLSFVVAVAPVALSIAELQPSRSCGPFREQRSVWNVVTSAFGTLPIDVRIIIFYLGTPGFAVPAFIILVLALYYFYAVSEANKHMVTVLKNQLVLEGHDKQFLLNRLSAIIKQQELNKKQACGVVAGNTMDVTSSITDNNSNASQSVH